MKGKQGLRKFKIYYGINLFISNDMDNQFHKQIELELNKLEKELISLNIITQKQYNINKDFISYNQECSTYLDVSVVGNKKISFNCEDQDYRSLIEIIKTYKVVPKLFIEKLDINNYKSKLVGLEHAKDILKSKLFKKYDNLFKKNFSVLNGINDVYEWYTGAVYFKDYEWEELTNDSLKSVFCQKDNDSYKYSLPVDNGILLRSASIYYYFSTDVSRFKKPTKQQIKQWHSNCKSFFESISKALSNYEINNNYNIRLLLAVLDNLRNIILLLFNTQLIVENLGNNFIYHLNNVESKEIKKYIDLTNTYQKLINNLCLARPSHKNAIHSINDLIKETDVISDYTIKQLNKIDDSFILAKCFNPLREIDNYFENHIISEYAIKEATRNINDNKDINLLAILYGGLELPFIIKNGNFINKNINISAIFQNHGMYLDRQVKGKTFTDNNIVIKGSIDKSNVSFLIDDNIMSGVTIQLIYNQLLTLDINVIGSLFIRHPNLNRLPQLKHFDIGMNLDLIDKWFYGMVTNTPYTKIKEKTNYNNMFVNELNIFSVMTEVFLKALYINNSFIKDSQVDIFKGYSDGKND